MTTIFTAILNASVGASFLILAVLFLRLVFRKSAPKWVMCLLWGIVAIRLILPFSIQAPFGLVPQNVSDVSSVLISGSQTDTDAAVSADPSAAMIPEPNAQIVNVSVNDPAPTSESSRNISFYLSIAWMGGMAVMLIYMLINYLQIRKRLADSVIYQKGIRQSEKIGSPFVFGLIKPTVYIPYGLEERVESFVLSHERAHISRGDHWFKFFWFCVLAIHWFNPFVWLAFICLCADIEFACDERVFLKMSEADRKEYASALVNQRSSCHRISACPVAFGETNVKSRISRIFHYRRPKTWILVIALVSCAILTACFSTVNESGIDFNASTETSESGIVSSDDSYFMFSARYDGTYSVVAKDTHHMPDDLVIPAEYNGQPVTAIEGGAFYDCSNLKSVVIPENIRIIGGEAFHGCSGLKSVTIPSSVTRIDRSVFNGCSNLESVTILSKIESLSNRVFDGCSNLKAIHFAGTEEEWNQMKPVRMELPESVTLTFNDRQ